MPAPITSIPITSIDPAFRHGGHTRVTQRATSPQKARGDAEAIAEGDGAKTLAILPWIRSSVLGLHAIAEGVLLLARSRAQDPIEDACRKMITWRGYR